MGVSELHGKVTRRILQSGYPGYPENEVPVGYVTNGIHTRSFVNKDMADLFEQYLGGRWAGLNESSLWSKVADIPDEEIWRVRERRREKLVQFARARLKHQYEQVGRSDYEVRMTREVLNPHALTIGFARRFATYKRATLLLSDPERLLRLLNDPARPMQIILAGKAHPKDDAGKELIQRVVQFARREDVRKSIVFLEDYEMCVARTMVQGVDIWLNTPRRPMEASGTSGMKILANGGLNLSIPDGWWAEAYEPGVGWSIGKGEDYADPNEQDRLESLALYDLLEKEVVPLFYDRSTGDLPRAWVSRIKNSIKTLCPVFNTNRMVGEYAEKFYFPAAKRFERLQADDHKAAKSLVSWKRTVGNHWNEVSVIEALTDHSEVTEALKNSDIMDKIRVGEYLTVKAKIHLGSLSPTDVNVQIIHGLLDSNHQIVNYSVDTLILISNVGGICDYEGEIPCTKSGQQGYSIRVVPSHPDAILPQELSLITWEG